jgi:Glycosyl-4,4'-diaponeurosporenoate acyltransferase
VRAGVLTAVGVVVPLAVAGWAVVVLDPTGPWFALVAVWAPMTLLGSVSHARPFDLGAGFHRLRPFERDGRVYERVGVRAAKSVARRPPVTWFNPGLRLPRERTSEQLTLLDRRMRTAEASHTIALVISAAVAAHAVSRGWWAAAAWTLLFDVVLNGYPIALQRYNRALLRAD